MSRRKALVSILNFKKNYLPNLLKTSPLTGSSLNVAMVNKFSEATQA